MLSKGSNLRSIDWYQTCLKISGDYPFMFIYLSLLIFIQVD
jgi:hypothetical protein